MHMDPETITEATRWKIVTDKENFDKLKTDESFWSVVALGRTVNAILFVHGASAAYENDDSPAGERARYNAVLFSCAILYESYLSIQPMGRHFKDLPEFKALSDLLNKKEAREILDSAISGLRNQVVFHYDPSAMGKQLSAVDLKMPVFLSAMGQTNEQIHFDLADRCALGMLHGPSRPALPETLEFAEKVSRLIIDFSNLAQELIVEVLAKQGWHREMQQ